MTLFELFTASFTPEQRERAKKCRTLKDLMKFSVEDDIELSEEALECVGGGFGTDFDSPVSTLIVSDDEYRK